jgi:hypothetical protein
MGLNCSTLRFVANARSWRGLGSTDYDLYNCTIIVVLLNDRIEASPQSTMAGARGCMRSSSMTSAESHASSA